MYNYTYVYIHIFYTCMDTYIIHMCVPDYVYLPYKDLYTTTNKCLQCLIKVMYTVF